MRVTVKVVAAGLVAVLPRQPVRQRAADAEGELAGLRRMRRQAQHL